MPVKAKRVFSLAVMFLVLAVLPAWCGCGEARPVDPLPLPEPNNLEPNDPVVTGEPTETVQAESDDLTGETISEDITEPVAPGTWTLVLPEAEVTAGRPNLSSPYLIYGLKEGFTTTVYRRNIIDGSQKTLLSFDEDTSAELTGNLWQGLPPSFALSGDGHRLAFIERGELKVLDRRSGQTVTVVEIIEPGDEMDRAPTWSREGMNKQYPVYGIFQPRWSADGEYLCFLESYWEGSSYGFIGVNSNDYSGYPISAYGSVVRGPVGHAFLIASSDDYNALRGLFATAADNISEIRRLVPGSWQWSETLYSAEEYDRDPFYRANYAPRGNQAAFIYSTFEQQELLSIALINLDGSGFKVLKEGGLADMLPFFAEDGLTVYFFRDLGEQVVLTGYELGRGFSEDLLVMPPAAEYNLWEFLSWTEEGYLVLKAYTNSYSNYRAGERARLVVLDLNSEDFVYASPVFEAFAEFSGLVTD